MSKAASRLVGSLGSTRKWVEPTAPAKAAAHEKAAELTQSVDLTPVCKSIDKLADAMKSIADNSPEVHVAAPNVTVEAPAQAASRPRSWICKHIYNASGDLIETKITAE